MINLQDTPSGGPLTADDLARYRAMHRPYIPLGIDSEGRAPDRAYMGVADDDLACASGIVRAVLWCLALYAVGIAAWVLVS